MWQKFDVKSCRLVKLDKGPIFGPKRRDLSAWCCIQCIVWILKNNTEFPCYNTGQHHTGTKKAVRSHVSICITKPSGFFDGDCKDCSLLLSSCVTHCLFIIVASSFDCHFCTLLVVSYKNSNLFNHFPLLITSIGRYYWNCHKNRMATPLDILRVYRLYLR